VGDINRDGHEDLVIGFPFSSVAMVYLGNARSGGLSNLIASFMIYGETDSEFGWAVSALGDINGDFYEDFMISAKAIGTIYVFFGKPMTTATGSSQNIYAENLRPSEGFKIVGNQDTVNLGLSIASSGDFNGDGHSDILFSAYMKSSSQGIVFVLLGSNSSSAFEDVVLNETTSTRFFKIMCLISSFSGLSLAGVGDMNNDGYDDIAIGSLPYKGGYQPQRTYLIYGRRGGIRRSPGGGVQIDETLDLAQMREGIDGIAIIGGGFLVAGPGDLNGDGLADLIIVDYPSWQGQSISSYYIQFPRNLSSSPSLPPSSLPSNQPTSSPSLSPTIMTNILTAPTNIPSVHSVANNDNSFNARNSSESDTFRPTPAPKQTAAPKSVRPTRSPTMVNSRSPTRTSQTPSLLPYSPAPSFRVGQQKPSASPVVVLSDTNLPTVDFKRLRGVLTFSPSQFPTWQPTINSTVYTNRDCFQEGNYQGKNETNFQFSIKANSGTVNIVGNDDGEAKNLYVLFCPENRVDVAIKNFRLSTDVINLMHLSEHSYYYPSLNEISYSLKSGQPLTLLFCHENKLQLILSSHTNFDLRERNFFFTESNPDNNENQIQTSQELMFVQIGIILGLILFLLSICLTLTYQNRKKKEKEDLSMKLQFEEEDDEDEDEDEDETSVFDTITSIPVEELEEEQEMDRKRRFRDTREEKDEESETIVRKLSVSLSCSDSLSVSTTESLALSLSFNSVSVF
jgi:hypothetical protein